MGNNIFRYVIVLLFFIGINLVYLSCTSVKKQVVYTPARYIAILDSFNRYSVYPSPFRDMMKLHKVKALHIEPDSFLSPKEYWWKLEMSYDSKIDSNGNTTYIKGKEYWLTIDEYYESSPTGFWLTQYFYNTEKNNFSIYGNIYKYNKHKNQLYSYSYSPSDTLESDTTHYVYYQINEKKRIVREVYHNDTIYDAEFDSLDRIVKISNGRYKPTYVFKYGAMQLDSVLFYYNGYPATSIPNKVFICDTTGLIKQRKDYEKIGKENRCVGVYRYLYKYYDR